VRIGLQGVRDDRLALRVGAGACAGRGSGQCHPESRDVECPVDHPEAAVEALNGPQATVTEMLDEYRRRRDALHEWLSADSRLRCRKPAGAFYMFVDIGDVLSGIDPGGFRTSLDFADALLEESRVALTPGEAFDAPGFIRISYATSMENLREGSKRLLEFVAKHAPQTAAAK
jgi:aspartate aminotransferase